MSNFLTDFIARNIISPMINPNAVSSKTKTGKSSGVVKFNSNRGVSSEKYVEELQKKSERVNSTWNRIKQSFGFGESLTREEEKVLIDASVRARHHRYKREQSVGEF